MDDALGNPKWLSVARSFVTSLGAPASDGVLGSLAPDVTYRVVGRHALSGEFVGREEVAQHLAAIVSQTDGRIEPVKFDDWMLGLQHVAILVDVHVEVGGASQRLRHLLLMRFNMDDLIEEVTVFFSDPDVAERVYGHRLRGS